MNLEKILEMVADVLKLVWSWPTVAVVIVILYRKEIGLVLARIATSSKAKFGGVEIEMGQATAGVVDARPGAAATQTLDRLQLTTIEGKEFGAERVDLDGIEYKGCKFFGSTLVYSGGSYGLTGCEFRDVHWQFAGHAERTLKFMSDLYHGAGAGGAALVEATFQNIRSGKVWHPKS